MQKQQPDKLCTKQFSPPIQQNQQQQHHHQQQQQQQQQQYRRQQSSPQPPSPPQSLLPQQFLQQQRQQSLSPDIVYSQEQIYYQQPPPPPPPPSPTTSTTVQQQYHHNTTVSQIPKMQQQQQLQNKRQQQQQPQQQHQRQQYDTYNGAYVEAPSKPPPYSGGGDAGGGSVGGLERAHKLLSNIPGYCRSSDGGGGGGGNQGVNATRDNNYYGDESDAAAGQSYSEGINSIDMRKVKEMFTDEYLRDLATFKSMNLMDDENLNELYSFTNTINKNPKVASTMFLTMYRDKYAELFDKYPSVESYLMFVIMGITCNGLEKFKKSLGSDGASVNNFIPIKKIRMSRFASNKALKNNAQPPAAAAAAAATTVDSDGRHDDDNGGSGGSLNDVGRRADTEDHNNPKRTSFEVKTGNNVVFTKKIISKKTVHPMYATSFFLQKRMLFTIGEMYGYILPADFAISEARCSKAVIKIYAPNNKHDVDGAELRFRIPILCRIQKRSVTTYMYNVLDNANNVTEFVSRCVGFPTKHINVSTKIKQAYCEIVDVSQIKNEFHDMESLFGVTSLMSFFLFDDKTVIGRCFTELMYVVSTDDRLMHTTSLPQEEDEKAYDELKEYNTDLLAFKRQQQQQQQ